MPARALTEFFAFRFRALKHRNFRLFWFGQMISITGTWMQSVAQLWLMHRLTESPSLQHFDNPRMIDGAHDVHLAHESRNRQSIAGNLRFQYFQRDRIYLFVILNAIDNPHAARTQTLKHVKALANKILKDYLVKGYALNEKRLQSQIEKYEALKQSIKLIDNIIDRKLLYGVCFLSRPHTASGQLCAGSTHLQVFNRPDSRVAVAFLPTFSAYNALLPTERAPLSTRQTVNPARNLLTCTHRFCYNNV